MRHLLLSLGTCALLFAGAQPSRANHVPNPERFSSGRLSVDSSTGGRCDSTGADRPSISVTGGAGDDPFVGTFITIPFGGPSIGDCTELLRHEEGRSRLELAAQLFEAGAISAQEFKDIAVDVANLIR